MEEKNLPDDDDDDEGIKNSYLGKSYWRNLEKMHLEFKAQHAVRFDSKQEDWCTYKNFEI
jgi:hypothetical protein